MLRAGEWRSPPVAVARSGRQRWRGIRAVPAGWGVLLAGSAVHGRGSAAPVRIVGVGGEGRVGSIGWLEAGRFARLEGARWVLELPAHHPAPGLGSVLTAVPILAACPEA